jgi:hypothetical protein
LFSLGDQTEGFRFSLLAGPFVEGLIWKDVTTYGEMDKLVKKGAANRTLITNMHRLSNRGHTLFTVKLIRVSSLFLLFGGPSSFSVEHLLSS